MQVKDFNKWDSSPYGEVGQQNPLRWMNLKQVDEDTFVPVTHWWKCKDFLNDAITAKHLGKTFQIYHFKCNPADFYSEGQQGMYILLKNVVDSWWKNMEVVNGYLNEQGFHSVGATRYEDKVIVYIPEEYLQNTLFISQVTLFIRMANVNKVCSTMEELAKESPGDSAYFQACMKKPLGKFPEKLKKYIWYYKEGHACEHGKPEQSFMTSSMHNCGVVAWGWE